MEPLSEYQRKSLRVYLENRFNARETACVLRIPVLEMRGRVKVLVAYAVLKCSPEMVKSFYLLSKHGQNGLLMELDAVLREEDRTPTMDDPAF